MDSQNIFDLFGRQKKTLDHAFIDKFFEKFDKSFKSHVKKTESLLNAISLSKNYIRLKNKRIVNVKPSINKYDVVIKSELDEVLESVIKVGNDHAKTEKDINEIVNTIINLGKYVENLEGNLEKELKILLDGANKEIKQLNDFKHYVTIIINAIFLHLKDLVKNKDDFKNSDIMETLKYIGIYLYDNELPNDFENTE